MKDNLILKTTAVVLAIAVFISANDAKDIRRSEQSTVCGPCQDNSSFSYVFILRGCGDHKSYMYIDLLSPNGSSNVVAKKYANPLDIRGKALHNYIYTTLLQIPIMYSSYITTTV